MPFEMEDFTLPVLCALWKAGFGPEQSHGALRELERRGFIKVTIEGTDDPRVFVKVDIEATELGKENQIIERLGLEPEYSSVMADG